MALQSIVALICPRCGGDLDGLETDTLFGCRGCSRAWEPSADGLGQPLPLVQACRGATEGVTLPFWRIKVGAMLLPEGVEAPERAHVPAFDLRRRSYFGDPALLWTVHRQEIEVESPTRPLAGATLGRVEAIQLTRFYLLRALDAQRDLTGFDYDIHLEEPELMLVTFADEGDGLIDPIRGDRYSAAAFCDLEAVRASQRR